MESATINAKGTQFAFLDSGAVPGETYTTLVVVHGLCFSADTFGRLLPKAKEHNLRIIALNRRDYKGSTPFTDEELEATKTTDEEQQKAFFKDRGLEIAEFLTWTIREKKIPRLSEDKKTGGLSLLGWSLGNTMTMSFFAHLNSYPEELVDIIRPFLKTHILYEPPSVALALQDPVGGYYPFQDPDLSPAEKIAHFPAWISSYYSHPYFAVNDSRNEVDKSVEQLYLGKPVPGAGRCASTTAKDSGQQLLACVDIAPYARAETFFLFTSDPAIRSSLWAMSISLKASDEASTASLLPDVNAVLAYGTATAWTCVACPWWMENDVEQRKKNGEVLRKFEVTVIEGENHFLHWDDPEKFLTVMSSST